MREYKIQLKSAALLTAIITAGGTCYVATNGAAAKATLYTAAGSSLANPVTPTRGNINFFVADSVSLVDLYILAPGGQFLVVKDLAASGPNEILVDTSNRHQCMVIPISYADSTAAAETATGFTEPANALMLPNPAFKVTAIDATETIDVGTLSTDSGDADGFLAAIDVATLGLVKATVVNGGNTMGALFEIQDSANSGDIAPEGHVSGEKSITYTTTAGSDTVEGFAILPYLLAA